MADHSSFCDAKGICFALQEKTSPAERRERESSFYEKEPEIDTKEFQVEKVITLPSEQYAYFTQHLMKEHDFIKENVDLMYEKDGVWHCLLVAGEGMDEGVLVESEGSAYARYSAFVPFAQEIIRQYQDMQETQTDVMQMKM